MSCLRDIRLLDPQRLPFEGLGHTSHGKGVIQKICEISCHGLVTKMPSCSLPLQHSASGSLSQGLSERAELKKSTPAALRASADVLVAQAQSRVTKMHPGSALEHLQKLAASPRSRFTFASTPDGHQMRNCILILKSSFLRKELASLHDKLTTFMLVDPLLVGSL